MKLTIDEKKGTFTVTGELQEATPSGSGKNLVIAGTGGNQKAGINWRGLPVTLGLNIYVPNKPTVAVVEGKVTGATPALATV